MIRRETIVTIKQWCEPWQHQFEFHIQLQGVSQWVCKKCGELREQHEDCLGG